MEPSTGFTQRVHLQLLSQADLLQAVVEVGLRVASSGWRQSEDTHDLPLVSKLYVNIKRFDVRQRYRIGPSGF